MQEKKLRRSESLDFSFKIDITNDSTFKIRLNSILYKAFKAIPLSSNFSDLIEVCNKAAIHCIITNGMNVDVKIVISILDS